MVIYQSVLQKGFRIYIRGLHKGTSAFKQRHWDFEGLPGLLDYTFPPVLSVISKSVLFTLSVLVWIRRYIIVLTTRTGNHSYAS